MSAEARNDARTEIVQAANRWPITRYSRRMARPSRAARLEYEAGKPELTDTYGDGQACYERRQELLTEAHTLRARAGQDPRVIESSQEHNFQRGVRGTA